MEEIMATFQHVFWITMLLLSNTLSTVQPETSQPHTIGVLAYVDYGLWRQWIALYEGDEIEANYRIKQYFVRVADRMNTHYASLDKYNLDMSVVLQRLEIATSSASAPWSSDNRIESTVRDLLNGSQAITDLLNEVTDNEDLQKYDHVIGFTGYDLFYDDTELSVIGDSLPGTLCSDTRGISIIEDNLDYMSALSASHEIAHNMGVEHDSDGNDCSADDYYIMAEEVETAISVADDAAVGIYCDFSECSADYIKGFISTLTDNCLLDSPQPYFTKEEVAEYLADVPGQRKNLDEQCQIHLGSGAVFCGEIYEDGIRCDSLLCRARSGDESCVQVYSVRVFDGTTCGDKKWCNKGLCVYNARAPIFEEGCPYGDYKNGNLCQRPDLRRFCYESPNRKLCCDTCSALRDTSTPDCLYGDYLTECKTDLEPRHCYSKANSKVCCEGCDKYEYLFRNAPQGCKYGDRVPYGVCRQRHCQSAPEICCATCTFGEGYRDNMAYPGQPFIPVPAATESVHSSALLILLAVVAHIV